VAVLLLRIRVRFELSKSQWLLFVGLGRSGPELDFMRNVGFLKLAGIRLKRFEIYKEERILPKARKKKRKLEETPPSVQVRRLVRFILTVMRKTLRLMWEFFSSLLKTLGAEKLEGRIARKSFRPMWEYFIGLLKAVAVEELEGRVEAGFDEPHLTGTVFGYYQAALAAVPSVVEKVQYVPDWTGASFRGSCKVAMALPLYELLGRTAVLIVKLPLRDIIKLAIGKKKKGESDVQQRRRDTQGRGQRAA
jgi:hypothetical protein